MRCLLEKSLWLRKLLGFFVSYIRGSDKVKLVLKKLGLSKVVWSDSEGGDSFKDLHRLYGINFREMIDSSCDRKVGLVALKDDETVESFFRVCDHMGIHGKLFDPSKESFFREISLSEFKRFIVRPSHNTQVLRQLFFEKIEVLSRFDGVKVYPSIKEQSFYESKRCLTYFLAANEIPCPKTYIFYRRKEALAFVEQASYPIVFKTNNGAGSSGIEIIKSRRGGRRIVKTCFDSYYLNKAITDYRDIDYGYIILQEFIPDAREYRVIKIGESWFGHEKSKLEGQEFMSGSGVNLWTRPSDRLLDFCENIAHKHSFTTMCFDVFEDGSGNYLVNELQTWFGSYNPSQMYVNGVPGRIVRISGAWVFQEGLFNGFSSLALRMVDFVNNH